MAGQGTSTATVTSARLWLEAAHRLQLDRAVRLCQGLEISQQKRNSLIQYLEYTSYVAFSKGCAAFNTVGLHQNGRNVKKDCADATFFSYYDCIEVISK